MPSEMPSAIRPSASVVILPTVIGSGPSQKILASFLPPKFLITRVVRSTDGCRTATMSRASHILAPGSSNAAKFAQFAFVVESDDFLLRRDVFCHDISRLCCKWCSPSRTRNLMLYCLSASTGIGMSCG